MNKSVHPMSCVEVDQLLPKQLRIRVLFSRHYDFGAVGDGFVGLGWIRLVDGMQVAIAAGRFALILTWFREPKGAR